MRNRRAGGGGTRSLGVPFHWQVCLGLSDLIPPGTIALVMRYPGVPKFGWYQITVTAAERLVRGPVHREDGQAKTFVKICFTLQVPGMNCLAVEASLFV